MLLPHPKYKGSFIALPAPSFSSKLIASETWMTLELEAPPQTTSGFLRGEVPLSKHTSCTFPVGRTWCRALPHLIMLLPRSACCCLLCIHTHSPAPSARGCPCSPTSSVWSAAHANCTPHAVSPEGAVADPGHAPGPCCLRRHALHAALKNWATLQLVMLIGTALTACTLLA